MNKGSEETINIQLRLTEELRTLLNNQETIKYESTLGCTQVPFYTYENNIMSETIITKRIFELLFQQYNQFQKIKDKLIVSTFRTTIIGPYGLNGETGFHRDNILFPGDCNRNLIITWGPGTEALCLDDSIKWSALRDEIIDEMWAIKDMKEQNDFSNYVQENILDVEKYIAKNNLKVIKSESPNADGNITALIMSGTKVLHRRAPCDEAIIDKKYRYVLNIYFNSEDLVDQTT